MQLPSWFGVLPLLFGGGAAEPFETPQALLEAIYAPLQRGEMPAMLEDYYSDRLQDLVADNLQRTVVDTQGSRIDPDAPDIVSFNPFVAGSELALSELTVGTPVVEGDIAVATVQFVNAERPTLLTVAMVREDDGWHVDDIAALGGDARWLYSWLLQYDPFGQQ